jgi:hypothetical protein
MRSTVEAFATWDGDTLVLEVAGKPGASRNTIGKVQANRLKVSVTAAPQAGMATEQMVRFLAKEFGVSPSDVEVVFGHATAHKRLRIRAPKVLPINIEWPDRATI